MKCSKHNVEAVGICAWCGRALCAGCAPATAPRLLCSEECTAAQAQQQRALRLILEGSSQSARANAFYCYLCGGLSAAGAVAAYYMLPSPFLIYFTGACAAVLMVSGFWFG